jgi:hypothetical protein
MRRTALIEEYWQRLLRLLRAGQGLEARELLIRLRAEDAGVYNVCWRLCQHWLGTKLGISLLEALGGFNDIDAEFISPQPTVDDVPKLVRMVHRRGGQVTP